MTEYVRERLTVFVIVLALFVMAAVLFVTLVGVSREPPPAPPSPLRLIEVWEQHPAGMETTYYVVRWWDGEKVCEDITYSENGRDNLQREIAR